MVKTLPVSARDTGSSLVQKTPHTAEQVTHALEPESCNSWAQAPENKRRILCFTTGEATTMRSWSPHTAIKSSPYSLHLEKALVRQGRSNTTKKKEIKFSIELMILDKVSIFSLNHLMRKKVRWIFLMYPSRIRRGSLSIISVLFSFPFCFLRAKEWIDRWGCIYDCDHPRPSCND